MDRTELAWAAGFFDAEGWSGAVKNRRRHHPHAQINQADPLSTPEVLERFRGAVGVGRLGGPARQTGKLDLYRWVASSRADVTAVYSALRPWLGEVKRAQLCRAIGVDDRPSGAPTADEQLAWAAGLFDGDGSTCLARHRTHEGYVTADVAITQSSRSGMPEVLRRFGDLMGVGRVYGPYGVLGDHGQVYRYKALRLVDVEHVIRSLWPFLGGVKRVQAATVLALVRSQPTLARGNPAWGSHKTHCVNGHEYATARIRPYRTRSLGTQRRESKQCLVCVREWARRHRTTRKTDGV